MQQITNLKKIKTLYQEGKLSRTTYWRAKKRGWAKINYHKKQAGNYILNKEEKIKLYWTIYKVAGKQFNIYKRRDYDNNTFKNVVADITGDVFLDILEYKQDLSFSIKKIHYKVREYLTRKGRYYEKYFIPADTEKNRKNYDLRNNTKMLQHYKYALNKYI